MSSGKLIVRSAGSIPLEPTTIQRRAMFKQHVQSREPNHRCPNCGRKFFNTHDNGQCYGCGEQGTDHGEEAGLPDPFEVDSDESGEW